MEKLYPAFIGKSGQFYVLRNEGLAIEGLKPAYMRRPSIQAYNERQGHPEIISSDEALADFEKEVTIDPVAWKVLDE